ncbi:MAG: hypothetical protein AB7Q37_09780 [Pyrinomonadaceae bacterium]
MPGSTTDTSERPAVDAAIVEAVDGAVIDADEQEIEPSPARPKPIGTGSDAVRDRQRAVRLYLFLPLLFLTAALMGGLRLASPDNAFVFVAPALICLVFGAVLMVLFVRGGLISIEDWFSDDLATVHNIANGVLLASVFAATVQVFNSVVPEAGLPFWVVAFCFAWTLWNNLFADLGNRKLLRSMIALFSFAFVAKYLILAGLTAPPAEGGWFRAVFEDPARQAVTWALDLPRYSAGTGYIQFFTLGFYFLGLYLLPRSADHV